MSTILTPLCETPSSSPLPPICVLTFPSTPPSPLLPYTSPCLTYTRHPPHLTPRLELGPDLGPDLGPELANGPLTWFKCKSSDSPPHKNTLKRFITYLNTRKKAAVFDASTNVACKLIIPPQVFEGGGEEVFVGLLYEKKVVDKTKPVIKQLSKPVIKPLPSTISKPASSNPPPKKGSSGFSLSSLLHKSSKTSQEIETVPREKLGIMDTYYRSTETSLPLEKSHLHNFKKSVTTLINDWYKTASSPSYTYSTTESSSCTDLSVLKYVLFSIGDDVSEDIVVSRDVSEFEDEIRVTFWREEGVVPVEVLEGMNGGEVPEEVKMEAKIKAQNHMKNSQASLNKSRAAFEMSALKNVETVRREVKLGGKKRDRRTLEEIQMDMKKKVKHVKEEGKEV